MSATKSTIVTDDCKSSTVATELINETNQALSLASNSCLRKPSIMFNKYIYEEQSPDIFATNDDDDDDNGDDDHDNKADNVELLDKQSSTEVVNKYRPSAELIQWTIAKDLCKKNDIAITANNTNTIHAANCQREDEILKRIRNCLSGILPPPSVTIPQINLIDQVLLHKDDIINFIQKSTTSPKGDTINEEVLNQSEHSQQITSLLKPSHSLNETQNAEWPDASIIRQHGLCYNICKASESIEYLNLSVIDRFIGNETSSSYQHSPSSAKKNSSRLKLLCKSPGNRLSHLAKRRAIFSSLHLASNHQKSTALIGPQILIDSKGKSKSRRKVLMPKRLASSSSRKDRTTPSSSARKQLFRNDVGVGASRENSKRALFQSPPQATGNEEQKPNEKQSALSLNSNKSTKRYLLFTPTKRNKDYSEKLKSSNPSYSCSSSSSTANCKSFESLLKRKRAVANDDDPDNELNLHNHKIFKANNNTTTNSLTPRALQIKSQSFCEGSAYSMKRMQQQIIDNNCNSLLAADSQFNIPPHHTLNTSISMKSGNKLPRTYTDYQPSCNSLTDNQKKKLLWAISQALQERKINTKHEQFKQYASTLAKVVKRIFQEYYHKTSTSNSETMLRLSKRYVHYVINGSSVDEIYLLAKQHVEETKRQNSTNRTIACLPNGLLGYLQQQQQQQQEQEQQQHNNNNNTKNEAINNIYKKQAKEVNHSRIENDFVEQRVQSNHQSSLEDVRVAVKPAGTNSSSKQPIPSYQASLRNSSSKCNLDGLVLSENANHDLRRSLSAQKNFTGKDQKNLSPYASNHPTSGIKAQTQSITNDLRSNHNLFKTVKRHIIFDS